MNKFYKLGYNLCKWMHWFLCKPPLVLNRQDELEFNYSKRDLCWYSVGLAGLLIEVLLCLYSFTYFVYPASTYKPGIVACHLATAIMYGDFVVVVFVIWWNREVVYGLNSLIRLRTQFKDNWSKEPMIRCVDLFILTLPIEVAFATIVTIPGMVYMEVDPLFTVTTDICHKFTCPQFPQYFGPIFLLVRVFMLLPAVEGGRTGYFLVWVMFLTIDTLHDLTDCIYKRLKQRHFGITPRAYVMFATAYSFIAFVFESALAVTYTAAFWFFIFGMYIMINGYQVVPNIVYWLVIGLFFPTVFVTIVPLILISNITSKSTAAVKTLQHLMFSQFRVVQTGELRLLALVKKKRADALKPVLVRYKPISVTFDKQFMKDWVRNCIDRLTDAVLLF